jgi:lysophospholipase L1-like esterase
MSVVNDNREPSRRPVHTAIALLFSIIISLVVAEALVRVADAAGLVDLGPGLADLPVPQEIADQVNLEGDQPLYVGDPVLHHRMTSNWTGFFPEEIMRRVGRSRVPVRTNSFGLRTPEILEPKPAGTYRILILGDSVTFGWGIRGEDTYGSQLASLLGTLRPEQRFEVINAGVSGYGTWQEALWLAAEGIVLEPDLIIVQVHLNDVADNLWGTMGWDPGGDPWLARTSMLAQLVSRVWQNSQAGNSSEPCASDWKVGNERVCWERTLGLLGDIQQTAQRNGIPLVLMPSPMRWQVEPGTADTRSWVDQSHYQSILAEYAQQGGWLFADPLPILRAASEGSSESLFLDVGHPAERGQRIVAEVLYETLAEAGALP